jgi:hypothetical protein
MAKILCVLYPDFEGDQTAATPQAIDFRSVEMLLGGRPIRDEYLIVDGGKLAGTGVHGYAVK